MTYFYLVCTSCIAMGSILKDEKKEKKKKTPFPTILHENITTTIRKR